MPGSMRTGSARRQQVASRRRHRPRRSRGAASRSSRIQIERPWVPAIRSVALDQQVVDRGDRQVELESPPVRAVVERDVEAGLGAGVEQPALAGSARMTRVKSWSGMPSLIRVQCLAVVASDVEIRLVVVQLVAGAGDVDRAGIERREARCRVTIVHSGRSGGVTSSHVVAVVAADVNQAVIRAGPEHALARAAIR